MTAVRAVIVLVATIMLTACASNIPLQRAQIGALTKESLPDEVDRVLGNATVVARTEFTANGGDFIARHFRLLTGSRQEMTMVCTPVCFPMFFTVPITTDYVVIQRSPSMELHAWGTLEELSKDPDDAVSSIMPTVKAELELATKKP